MNQQSADMSPAERESAALDRLNGLEVKRPPVQRYGEGDDQYFESYGTRGGRRIVVVHGGYFRPDSDRSNVRPLAVALAARFPHCEVILAEYSVKPGNPEASMDDIRGLDYFLRDRGDRAGEIPLWIGHSAGGTLVLLLALSHGHSVIHALALAPLGDLRRSVERGDGEGAVEAWLGGTPEDVPDHYERFDPARVLGSGRRSTGRMEILHGAGDKRVSPDLTAGLPVPATFLMGAHHFDLIDPGSSHITDVYAVIEDMLAR